MIFHLFSNSPVDKKEWIIFMKKAIIVYLLLITAQTQLFTGCKKDDSPVNNTTPTAQIIPLSVDNSWQYVKLFMTHPEIFSNNSIV